MSQYLHDDNNDDAKAITVPRVFSENSRAKKPIFRVSLNDIFTSIMYDRVPISHNTAQM